MAYIYILNDTIAEDSEDFTVHVIPEDDDIATVIDTPATFTIEDDDGMCINIIVLNLQRYFLLL